jgi:hypothetical protein
MSAAQELPNRTKYDYKVLVGNVEFALCEGARAALMVFEKIAIGGQPITLWKRNYDNAWVRIF